MEGVVDGLVLLFLFRLWMDGVCTVAILSFLSISDGVDKDFSFLFVAFVGV